MTAQRGDGLFAHKTPRVFSIEAGRPFLRDLASALTGAVPPDDPLALAEIEILLPTRRSARALSEAFVAVAPGTASLLPRIRPLGDIDEDEIFLETGADADDGELPPAISPLERRLVLARLVAAADRNFFAGQKNWPAAIAAAQELGALLDSFYAEEIDFSRLDTIVPAEHAGHWERTLDFLRIVTEAWPAYLAERGMMDPADRRARLIDIETKRFSQSPPDHPVIIAGTTGSAPAVARLMQTVAHLPKGAVVLPGLDAALTRDAKAWRAIEDPHPQAGLKALLEKLGLEPDRISPWPGGGERIEGSARTRLLSLALRPAEATDDWREEVATACVADPRLARACDGLTLIEAVDEEAEATAVAILMRETLETPDKTAMLVTPDRNLSRRVAARMRRWNVAVDDSAGVPFANSPCGTYLRLLAQWLAAPSDPHAVLSLAKSPLAGFGLGDAEKRRATGALDEGLRGLAPSPGASGLADKLAASAERTPRLDAQAAPIVAQLDAAARLWPRSGPAAFTTFLDAHIAAAELLAASDSETGDKRLWRGEDGEAGALLLSSLRETAGALGDIKASDYAPAFAQLLSGANVRRRSPAHPRLSILGPLEARLQSADLVILGGLNEGVWPGDTGTDPFLSRRMRVDLGLPSPERRVGLAAHDFAQGAAAPQVALTRAQRSGGAPAKPSRWVVRLRNILAGAGALDAVDAGARFAAWSAALDEAGPPRRIPPPRPTPPVEARPRKLSVTRIEKWLRDPYSIYAENILGLRKLDPLGEPFGARQLGSLLHKVFERAARENTAKDALAAILESEAPRYGLDEVEKALWLPALKASLEWFSRFHADRMTKGAPAVIEQKGAGVFDAAAGPFTIEARADRIDLLANGTAFLIDYKSGKIPTAKELQTFNIQLPLTASIVAKGGFEELGMRKVAAFWYVKSLGRKEDGKSDATGAEGEEAALLSAQVLDGLMQWIAAFDNQATPYLSQPRPQFTDVFGDYDHLARRREWSVGSEE